MRVCVCVDYLRLDGGFLKYITKHELHLSNYAQQTTPNFHLTKTICCHVGALLGEGDKHRLT